MASTETCQMLIQAMRDEVKAQEFYDTLSAALRDAGYNHEAAKVVEIGRDESTHAWEYLDIASAVGCDVPQSLERQVEDLRYKTR